MPRPRPARDGAELRAEAPSVPAPVSSPTPAVAALVTTSLLWGATFVIIRDSVAHVEPRVLVAFRFGVATLILLAVAIVTRRRFDRVTLLGGTVAGAAAAGGFLFQAIGLTQTSAGTSAFLTSIGTLLAGVFAWPMLGQRPGKIMALGLGLAAAGSGLIAGRAGLILGAGEWWTLIGAVCYGLQVVALARFAPAADPIALATMQAFTIFAITGSLAIGAHGTGLAAAGPWRLGYLVVAGSVLGPLLQIVAQRRLSAARVALLLALEPVFALGFALTFGAERFPPRWFAGAFLILGAVLAVETHAAAKAAAARPASA